MNKLFKADGGKVKLTHLDEITTKLQDVVKQFSEMLNQKEPIGQLISFLKSDFRQKCEDNKQLESSLQLMKASVSKLTETVKTYEQDLSSVKRQLQEKDTQIKHLESQLNEVKAELESTKRSADATRKRQQNEVVQIKTTVSKETVGFARDTLSVVKYVQKRESVCSSNDRTAGTSNEHIGMPCLRENFERLKIKRETVAERLEAKKVAAWMYQNSALTVAEFQSVNHWSSPCDTARTLIDLVLKKANEDVHTCFLEAILQANQPDIFSLLSYQDYIDCQHAETIRRHYVDLLNSLDAKNGLLDKLYSYGVLDSFDYEDLKTEQVPTRLNEKLLLMLIRKSTKLYEVFLGALRKTGQSHILQKLEEQLEDDKLKQSAEFIERVSIDEDDQPNDQTVGDIEAEDCPLYEHQRSTWKI